MAKIKWDSNDYDVIPQYERAVSIPNYWHSKKIQLWANIFSLISSNTLKYKLAQERLFNFE